MNATDIAAGVLLTAGVVIVLGCTVGVLAMRTPLDRLHYVGVATTPGVAAIVGAVILREPSVAWGVPAVVVGVVLIASGPIVAHATARAVVIRQRGGWQLTPEEGRRP